MNICKSVFLIFVLIEASKGKKKECIAIDLTKPFSNNMVKTENEQSINFSRVPKDEHPYWSIPNEFRGEAHQYTYISAPYRVREKGWQIGDIPIENLLVRGVKLDMTKEVKRNGDSIVTVKHLSAWKDKHGSIPKRSVLLLYFGWNYKNCTDSSYFERTKSEELPGVSLAAALWIKNNLNIVGIGTDAPSLDPTQNVQYLFALNNIYVLENVNITSSLPDKNFVLSVMPMLSDDDADEAPVRLVAYPLDCFH